MPKKDAYKSFLKSPSDYTIERITAIATAHHGMLYDKTGAQIPFNQLPEHVHLAVKKITGTNKQYTVEFYPLTEAMERIATTISIDVSEKKLKELHPKGSQQEIDEMMTVVRE